MSGSLVSAERMLRWAAVPREIWSLRRSKSLVGGASNASYSILEYLVQPVLVIVSAPFLISRLGVDRYGVWMLASAIAGTIGIFHIGLGEATIKYISSYKGRGDFQGVARVVSGTVTLAAILGAIAAGIVLSASSFFVNHVFKIDPRFEPDTLMAIRIAGVVLCLQSVYQVLSNTLKGFELYGPPARVAIFNKGSIILGAVLLATLGFDVASIMVATAVTTAIGILWLAVAVRRLLRGYAVRPTIDLVTWKELFGFGVYSWIQNTAGVIFGQADKFLIAAMLGPASVAYYTLCLQLAQQVHALPNAGLNFLFPYISASQEVASVKKVRRIYRLAVPVNIAVAICLALPLVLFGRKILTVWMGANFSAHAYPILAVLSIAFALLSANIVPYFTLLGLGEVRFVSLANTAGGVVSLLAAALLIPIWGLAGAAVGRLFYAPVTFVTFVKATKTI